MQEKANANFRLKKNKPNLREYIAATALLHYYEKDMSGAEQKQIRSACKTELSGENHIRIVARSMKEQHNNRLIEAVLQDLNEQERQFLYEKYKKNTPELNIGLKLNTVPTTLQYWRRSIFTEMAELLFFKLPRKDAFSIRKVSTLADVLREYIDFLSQHDLYIDPDTLHELRERQIVYEKAGRALQVLATAEPKNIMETIVKARLVDRFASIETLAKRTGVSVGMAWKQLEKFISQHYHRTFWQ